MEAEDGKIDNARRVFQRGVWAAPKRKGISRLWQAWAECESKAGDLETARKYFKYVSR